MLVSVVKHSQDSGVKHMASKFKQFLEDILHGRDVDQEQEQGRGGRDEIDEIEASYAEQTPEQAQGQQHWLDEEVEKQRGQQLPDAAYQVPEHDEPAPEVQQEQAQEPELQPEPLPEQAPEHELATGEITPGQSDIQHDGLQQDGTMDRETMSDGLNKGGEEIEMEM